MKNSALILTFVAIAAIAFVVWFIFMKKSPQYTSWGAFSEPYRPVNYTWCQCSNGDRCRGKNGDCTCCAGNTATILK